jgi:protein-S-isoprenylcysteine O-methyltransferase Ste14
MENYSDKEYHQRSLIVAIPLLILLIVFVVKISINSNNPQVIGEGVGIIANSAILWGLVYLNS